MFAFMFNSNINVNVSLIVVEVGNNFFYECRLFLFQIPWKYVCVLCVIVV